MTNQDNEEPEPDTNQDHIQGNQTAHKPPNTMRLVRIKLVSVDKPSNAIDTQ